MIIGTNEGQLKGAETHLVKKSDGHLANKTTGSFRLDTVSKELKEQYRNYYSDLSNIGLYYILYEKNNPTKKRQYTICNALIPDIRKAAIDLMTQAIHNFDTGCTDHDKRIPDFDKAFFTNEDNQSGFWLSMKDYSSPTGIATLVHAKEENEFIAKGPVGKSLFDNGRESKSLDGLYVAFAAGTGAFVYFDLIFRIFLQNYEKAVRKQNKEMNPEPEEDE